MQRKSQAEGDEAVGLEWEYGALYRRKIRCSTEFPAKNLQIPVSRNNKELYKGRTRGHGGCHIEVTDGQTVATLIIALRVGEVRAPVVHCRCLE